jgi:chemotaxis protein methyltransferase CheR
MTAITPPPPPKARDGRPATTSPEPTRKPDPAPTDLTELAKVRRLADLGDLGGALSSCRTLLDKDALNPSAHFYHALILEQMGHHKETEQALRRAIYLDRDYILAHYYLGLLQQKQGVPQRAVRSFQNVLQLLSRKGDGATVLDADDLTVADMRALTQRHLEVLQGS